ncbi:hypothetical protein F3I62_18810 [Pseudomonas sp. R-28-1W-6]|uniref:hypothetical protein n=1 Tax=Pseudomonas sp. R-28-1W-6 TaxID=2650101 RepID=UPI001365E8B5|nr:hypothetical protein [Pseudomonas sp. R-28-1W-6]MWV14156.1 hypothetical protein [Pseudomonas sp. R-28-1W-6]
MAPQASTPKKPRGKLHRISYEESLVPGNEEKSKKEAARLYSRANTREARRERMAQRVHRTNEDESPEVNPKGDGLSKAIRMSSACSRERDEVMDFSTDYPFELDAATGTYVQSKNSCGHKIDAGGTAALYTPAPLLSGPNMVSAHKIRKPAIATMVIDYEAMGLNPTAVQSGTLYQIRNNNHSPIPVSEESEVVRVKTISQMHHEMFSRCFNILQFCVENNLGGGTIHIFAHNLDGFDGICTSKHLNIKKGEDGAYFTYRHNEVDYFVSAEITKFGSCSKITFEVNLGKNGTFRFEMIDSMALMAVNLGAFATYDLKKDNTPFMFTNTLEWLHEQGYGDITQADLLKYIDNSHKYELLPNGYWITNYFVNDEGVEVYTSCPIVTKKHPRGHLFSDRLVNAITHWKSFESADAIRYGKHDVLMLANALNACYSVCGEFGIRSPSAYQTIAQIGAQGQICGITADLYVRNEKGEIQFEDLREGFLLPYPVRKYAHPVDFTLAIANHRGHWILNAADSEYFMRTGVIPKKSMKGDQAEDDSRDNLPRVAIFDKKENAYRIGIETKNEETGKVEFECEVTVRFDGLMESTGVTVQMQTWYISEKANRYCFYAQYGGRNDVICPKNPTGTVIVVVDANSMYPSVMRDGVRLRFPEKDYFGKQAYYNAILGYVDPRLMDTGSTGWMRNSGLSVKARQKKKFSFYSKAVFNKVPELFLPDADENGYVDASLRDQIVDVLDAIKADKTKKGLKHYDFSPLTQFPGITVSDTGRTVTVELEREIDVVLGRQNALMVLQARGGIFYAKLPRSLCKVMRKVGALPVTLTGSDHDGRVCYPDWKDGRLWGYFTAEELQYFLSQPTVDDSLVEIDLSRSCHAPILGVGVGISEMGVPYTFGEPMSCFHDYIDMAWKARHKCKKELKALDAKLRNLESLTVQNPVEKDRTEAKILELKLRSLMIKTFMNAGGFGVQAQNVKPTVEFNSDDLVACLNAVTTLSTQDDSWGPVDGFTRTVIKRLDRFIADFKAAEKEREEERQRNGEPEGSEKAELPGCLQIFEAKYAEVTDALSAVSQKLPMDGVSLADREVFVRYLDAIRRTKGEEAIANASPESDLGRAVSILRELSARYSWNDLRFYLSILNELILPDIEAVRSMEEVILSNRLKVDDDAEDTIRLLRKKAAFRHVGEMLLERTDVFNQGHPRITSLSELWKVIEDRLVSARAGLKADLDIYRHIFAEFAANHFRSFQAVNLRMDDGRRVVRYIMSTIEVTASHANRAFAISIPAKGRVKLHMALRAAYDLGFEVAYFDTDSLHLIIPCSSDEIPEALLIKAVKDQADFIERFASCRYDIFSTEDSHDKEVVFKTVAAGLDADMVIRNLNSVGATAMKNEEGNVFVMYQCSGNPHRALLRLLQCKPTLEMGDDLGQWDIEPKIVEKEYAVPGKWKKGDLVRASNVFYLGKKVVMFCDDEYNLLDCRVAGISLKKKLERAALMTIVQQTGSIGDRAGIIASPPVLIDRLAEFEMGTDKNSNRICGMFANSSRLYPVGTDAEGKPDYENLSSTPIVLSPKLAMKSNRFVSDAEGTLTSFYDPAFKRGVMSAREAGASYSEQGYARNHLGGLAGMEAALKLFLDNVKVGGKLVADLRKEIDAEFKLIQEGHDKGRITYELDGELYGELSIEDVREELESERIREDVLAQLA